MHSPPKTGVLTFHRCINYGSYWQAKCLVEALQARGHDAVLLDHDSSRVNFAEWKCAFRPTLPTPVPSEDYPRYREKMQKFFCAFEALPMSPRFDLDDPTSIESYDNVVVGSDEVWNLSHPWYGCKQLFYGTGIKTQRLISYAASFGNYDAWWGLPEFWAGLLQNFDAISVRDENSRAIIVNALGSSPAVVLDPCLQFPIQLQNTLDGPDKPYAAVYGHNFSPWFGEYIRRWAASRNLRLISIGYRNDWADEQWLEAGPHEFAQFMARAEAVATNFFHGCVFALRNGRPFVCEIQPYRFHKVQDLMTTVGGEHHLVREDTPFETYEARLNAPLEPAIPQRIEQLRQHSAAYLDQALAPHHGKE
jgi:hypothetical protein